VTRDGPHLPRRVRSAGGGVVTAALSVAIGIVEVVHTSGRSRNRAGAGALEPHVPFGRLEDGTWLYAPFGDVLVVTGGDRIMCHACGDALEAITRHHARRHGLDLAGYRKAFGLNRNQSLVAPALAQTRREEGKRRWETNTRVRDGLAVGQAMARSGDLHAIGVAAQPAGSRRQQGRRPASGNHAPPALSAARAAQAAEARQRWDERARELGWADLETYLAGRGTDNATPWQIRRELGCGSPMAARLMKEGR
jgi:ROS/MUCR transcriptional regulator protein